MKLSESHRNRLFRMLDEEVVEIVGTAALQDHFDTLIAISGGADTPDQIQQRFRWNMLYRIPLSVRQSLIDAIYVYADDEHIDAALRSYIKHRPALLKFVERTLTKSATGAA